MKLLCQFAVLPKHQEEEQKRDDDAIDAERNEGEASDVLDEEFEGDEGNKEGDDRADEQETDVAR